MHDDVLSRRGCLADKRGLFEGDEHGAHARHVFGLLAGLGVEVAEPGHPLPLRARVVLVQVRDHGLLGRPACNGEGGEGRVAHGRISGGRGGTRQQTCDALRKVLC